MHACGHDGHVAMLLGAAHILAKKRDEIPGTVVLCFQPAEEGLGGARAMVEAGILEEYGIERAYGLHLASKYPVGMVGFTPGPLYASSDSIEITIHGKGGHGASPHLSIDPIFVASNFVVSLQQIVSRVIDPIEPAVVTIGAFHAGTTYNVIPTSAHLKGTVRAFDDGVRKAMKERIERVLAGVCDRIGRNLRLRISVALSGDGERSRTDHLCACTCGKDARRRARHGLSKAHGCRRLLVFCAACTVVFLPSRLPRQRTIGVPAPSRTLRHRRTRAAIRRAHDGRTRPRRRI